MEMNNVLGDPFLKKRVPQRPLPKNFQGERDKKRPVMKSVRSLC